MSSSSFEEAVTDFATGMMGIVAAYGIGLGIALAKNYRDPYYFFGWPSSVKGPIFVAVLYFAFVLLKGAIGLLGVMV